MGRGGGFPARLMETLKNEQDYDDRAENDHPIGNLNTRYRCFLLEPFHWLPPPDQRPSWSPRTARRIASNIAKLPELVRICAELSRAVLPGPSAIYPSERLLLGARSSL